MVFFNPKFKLYFCLNPSLLIFDILGHLRFVLPFAILVFFKVIFFPKIFEILKASLLIEFLIIGFDPSKYIRRDK